MYLSPNPGQHSTDGMQPTACMREKYHTDPEFKSRHTAYVINSRKKKRANTE